MSPFVAIAAPAEMTARPAWSPIESFELICWPIVRPALLPAFQDVSLQPRVVEVRPEEQIRDVHGPTTMYSGFVRASLLTTPSRASPVRPCWGAVERRQRSAAFWS